MKGWKAGYLEEGRRDLVRKVLGFVAGVTG